MNQEERKKFIEEVLEDRKWISKVKSEAVNIYYPYIFELEKENFSNTRNSIIISGALASLILLMINNSSLNIILNITFVLSLISFLIAILLYSLYLKENAEGVIKAIEKDVNFIFNFFKEGEEIINLGLEWKITPEEYRRRMRNFKLEADRAFLREKVLEKFEVSGKKLIIFLAKGGNFTFITGIVLLIFGFILILILNYA